MLRRSRIRCVVHFRRTPRGGNGYCSVETTIPPCRGGSIPVHSIGANWESRGLESIARQQQSRFRWRRAEHLCGFPPATQRPPVVTAGRRLRGQRCVYEIPRKAVWRRSGCALADDGAFNHGPVMSVEHKCSSLAIVLWSQVHVHSPLGAYWHRSPGVFFESLSCKQKLLRSLMAGYQLAEGRNSNAAPARVCRHGLRRCAWSHYLFGGLENSRVTLDETWVRRP